MAGAPCTVKLRQGGCFNYLTYLNLHRSGHLKLFLLSWFPIVAVSLIDAHTCVAWHTNRITAVIFLFFCRERGRDGDLGRIPLRVA